METFLLYVFWEVQSSCLELDCGCDLVDILGIKKLSIRRRGSDGSSQSRLLLLLPLTTPWCSRYSFSGIIHSKIIHEAVWKPGVSNFSFCLVSHIVMIKLTI